MQPQKKIRLAIHNWPVDFQQIIEFSACMVLDLGLGLDLGSTNQVFAIKVISKAKMDAATIEASNSESAILRSLQHPFIVELHFAFQTKERLYLVMVTGQCRHESSYSLRPLGLPSWR